MSLIYKILPRLDWETAKAAGVFKGSGIDLKDGYIHFSDASQVEETARLHFRGLEDLVVFSVEADELGPDLVWEPSRGGSLFAHLYGPLNTDRVIEAAPAPLGPDGAPIIPLVRADHPPEGRRSP